MVTAAYTEHGDVSQLAGTLQTTLVQAQAVLLRLVLKTVTCISLAAILLRLLPTHALGALLFSSNDPSQVAADTCAGSSSVNCENSKKLHPLCILLAMSAQICMYGSLRACVCVCACMHVTVCVRLHACVHAYDMDGHDDIHV